MVNNLYFCTMFDKELKAICEKIKCKGYFTISQVLENDLFEVIGNGDVYQIIPLFNYNTITSNNPNDIIGDNYILAEKNLDTIIEVK